MGEGKARPTALNGAVNRPHLRRKCLRQNQTPICPARNGSPARQGKLVADFGDGLRLTATVRDVGRTKSEERCLDWGERTKGPLSPCSVDWNLSPAHQSAGSFPYSGRYFFQTVGRNETRQVGAFHAEPPEAEIETSSKSNISLRCRMSAWSPDSLFVKEMRMTAFAAVHNCPANACLHRIHKRTICDSCRKSIDCALLIEQVRKCDVLQRRPRR